MIFLRRDEGVPPTPVRELYAVFRRPALPNDLRVQQLARRDSPFSLIEPGIGMPPHIRSAFREGIGTPRYDDTRLIVGTTERGIYAVPTTSDSICLGSFPNGGSGCGQPGPHGVQVEWDEASGDSPFLLYGIVGDDVSSVDVVIDGRRLQAELGENGYWLVLDDADRQQLREVILRLDGGGTHVLPLAKPDPLG